MTVYDLKPVSDHLWLCQTRSIIIIQRLSPAPELVPEKTRRLNVQSLQQMPEALGTESEKHLLKWSLAGWYSINQGYRCQGALGS